MKRSADKQTKKPKKEARSRSNVSEASEDREGVRTYKPLLTKQQIPGPAGSTRGKTMARKNTQTLSGDDGRTQQHFKDECDVNRIVKRFSETGIAEHLANGNPQFAFCSSQSFTEAQFIVADMKSHFERLPSKTRAHFGNDPANFLEAHDDPERRQELFELGLAEAPPEPEPDPVEAPDPPPAEPAPQATKSAEKDAD